MHINEVQDNLCNWSDLSRKNKECFITAFFYKHRVYYALAVSSM